MSIGNYKIENEALRQNYFSYFIKIIPDFKLHDSFSGHVYN